MFILNNNGDTTIKLRLIFQGGTVSQLILEKKRSFLLSLNKSFKNAIKMGDSKVKIYV